MTLKYNDLVGTILPTLSIDEFEPKAGSEEDVIVVAFYATDRAPAEDLNTFLQRGFVDTLDIDISASTDDDGNYLVFVEMSRNETFPEKFRALLRDVNNVVGKVDWKIRTYLSYGKTYSVDDPELYTSLVLDPSNYVTKSEYKHSDMKETIDYILSDLYAGKLTITESAVRIQHNGSTIAFDVIDAGDYDMVVGRNFLAESAYMLNNKTYEMSVLQNLLHECTVIPLGDYLSVHKQGKIMLLSNTHLEYRTF